MSINYTRFSTFVNFENFCKFFFSNACLVYTMWQYYGKYKTRSFLQGVYKIKKYKVAGLRLKHRGAAGRELKDEIKEVAGQIKWHTARRRTAWNLV